MSRRLRSRGLARRWILLGCRRKIFDSRLDLLVRSEGLRRIMELVRMCDDEPVQDLVINVLPLPAELLISGAEAKIVRRRQSYADLISMEITDV